MQYQENGSVLRYVQKNLRKAKFTLELIRRKTEKEINYVPAWVEFVAGAGLAASKTFFNTDYLVFVVGLGLFCDGVIRELPEFVAGYRH